MGTPDFAKESLEAIYEAGYEILAVVTNPDKPKGRGMKMIASPVKEYALEKNLKIYQPLKVRNNFEFIEEIKSLNPDMLCVVAYGKILPKELLEIPKYGSINVHGSLLPKYRGAAPIQWSVLNGDSETGITTMFMDEGMDTGDMILQEKVTIDKEETTGELWDKLSKIGAKLLVETIKKIEEAEAKGNKSLEEIKKEIGAKKQPEECTIAPMLKKEMAEIDWKKSANEIHNLIRGLNPIMGAYTYINQNKVKIWKAEIIENTEFEKLLEDAEENKENYKKAKNGEIVLANKKKGLYIKAKDGIISVTEIQGENAKKMDIKSFLNGNKI
jgi:methionyl-tRNA formyltransferase